MLDLNVTMIFQLVNFLVAIYVLNILLIRPIRDIIKKRNGIMDGMAEEAEAIENAVSKVLDKGLRTADNMSDGCTCLGCTAMGDAILAEI